MAKIWPVYEGKEPTMGGPWAELPASEAISIFELRPGDFVSDPEMTPRFGNVDRDLLYAGFRHIVVEIGRSEGRRVNWKPGFYRSRVKPEDAFGRLIRQALAAELGQDNVVRVEYGPAIDSLGRDALRVTVVVAPGATKKLKSGAALDALVRLRERLHEMREERTPIIEYATEAELREDVGP
ncbi:MAG TPA: hypothetical protein VGA77_04065 [Propylenella sp.]